MSDFPSSLHNKMDAFEESLTEVEDVLKPFLKVPIADLHEKVTKFSLISEVSKIVTASNSRIIN